MRSEGVTATLDDPFVESVPALLAIARRQATRVVGTSDAEDIAQEALLRLRDRWSEVSGHAERWIGRVAVNLAIDAVRRRRVAEGEVVVIDDGGTVVSDLRLDLVGVLASLPERQRQVVVLRHLLDHSESTVADLLGISAGSVKRHLHRAVARLRAELIDDTHPERHDEEAEMATAPLDGDGSGWRGLFRLAVPRDDWPERPWDHCYVEAADGTVERIAVDADGQAVLDADGDEVMTGPGVDHEVVKVERGTSEEELPDLPPLPALSPEVEAVLDEAIAVSARWGHAWIGTEHFDLALLWRHPEAGAQLLVDHDTLAEATARFYEGPHADARLARVAQRREAGWRQPTIEGAIEAQINGSLTDLLRRAAVVGEPVTLRAAMEATADPTQEHCLRRVLLAERG